jgi:hypothetical protein
MQNRKLWVLLTVLVASVQALDSGILQAGWRAQVLVVLGLAAMALALALTARRGVWVAALIAAAGLFVWARVISLVDLNTLHIGLMVPAMYILFVSRLEKKADDPNHHGASISRA